MIPSQELLASNAPRSYACQRWCPCTSLSASGARRMSWASRASPAPPTRLRSGRTPRSHRCQPPGSRRCRSSYSWGSLQCCGRSPRGVRPSTARSREPPRHYEQSTAEERPGAAADLVLHLHDIEGRENHHDPPRRRGTRESRVPCSLADGVVVGGRSSASLDRRPGRVLRTLVLRGVELHRILACPGNGDLRTDGGEIDVAGAGRCLAG